MIGDRARDQGDWIKMSQALVDVAVVALKAAEAKNPEALFEAAGEVYAVCQECHSRYWKQGGEARPRQALPARRPQALVSGWQVRRSITKYD